MHRQSNLRLLAIQEASDPDVVRRFEARGVQFILDGEHLRCRASKGVLTPALQAEIAGLKSEIMGALRASVDGEGAIVPHADRSVPFPLSFAQERLWFLHQLEPDNPSYNITACWSSSGLIPAVLQASLEALVARHESLRTTFGADGGRPFQRVSDKQTGDLRIVDLREVPPDRRQDVSMLAREQTREPFDLAAGPLFRAMLVITDDRQTVVFTVHHIVADGWSQGILLRELRELYTAKVSGRAPLLPKLSIQYADYAASQRERLTGEALEPDITYWKDKLAGASRLLELPLDRPRPAIQGFDGAVHRFTLPKDVSAALRRLGRQESASLFMVLLAVFKGLLSRYGESPDILVGSPVTTRSTPELENMVGMLVNTAVLRTAVTGDLTARQLVRRVRETVLEAHSHLELPFEQLIQVLRTERSRSHSSLFQVSFVLQNTPGSDSFETISASAMFDLSLFMWDGRDGIGGALEYRTELFDHETVARMAGHFTTLARAIAFDANRSIASAPILASDETVQILDDWNRTAVDFPREALVHEIVNAHLGARPGRVAVRCGDATRTCAQVSAHAASVAATLRSLGVGRGDVVGVYVDRSIEMPSVLLGILQAGAAYVPLDPVYPADRLAYMLADSGARVLIADRQFADRLPAGTPRVVWLEPSLFAATDAAPESTDRRATADDLAYVLYTSGSTGRPKGVEIPHRAVVNFLESMRRAPGLAEGDRLLAVTTLCFDIAGLEMYLPLLCGGEVVVAPSSAVTDPTQLQELLRTHAITVMQATPSMWRMLLDAGWSGRPGFKVLCGGEAMNRRLADRLLAGGAEVWNLYGPTETTIWSTLERITPGDGPITVGTPIANTSVYVLDTNQQPRPVGVTGELYIGGDGLARGYRNRPDLTATAFVPDPFVPGRRLYRTGDLARWRADGRIEVLGRTDHQVKIRGYRIELDEVAEVVRRHPAVREAAVTLSIDNAGEPALACYVVASASAGLVEELRTHVGTQLPAYMVPASFTMLEALPLTANGKLDRKALPAPTPAVAPSTDVLLPHDLIETQLVSIWEHVLGVQGIRTTDNFFHLGGHSLLAMKLFAQLEPVFGRLPISLLFEAPTVEEMARRLNDEGHDVRWRSLVAIQPSGDRSPLFLIPGITGNVLSCTELAASLGAGRPLYGLHAVGLDGKDAPLNSVEKIAAHYVDEIRSAQPRGPYHLAGVCVGGAIAFEIAQRLREAGESVGSLTMIDTWPPQSVRPLTPGPGLAPAIFLGRRIWSALRTVWRMPPEQRVKELRRKLRLVSDMMRGRRAHDALRSELYYERVEQSNYHAMSRYKPKPYAGSVALIVAEGRHALTPNDPRLEWTWLAEGGHVIHRVDTTSAGRLLKAPFVGRVAQFINETLAAAETGPTKSIA